MKIALPIKMNNSNSAIAPLFGKAKWFAIIDNDTLTIVANPAHGGGAVIDWLASIHVDTIILQEMGMNPYRKVQAYGNIKLYHIGFERVLLQDVLEKFKNNALTLLDEEEMAKVIAHHEKKHPAHDHHH
ncbi:MAG: Unknown protein [uncultured Sulfurovum sp.]|uniref:Dinitrogenase iron-molybdenum cofactor biosynthesis domain-containing protein n=1 Tax=uncultured Sulfurovum sp. TaxID=269237 RepID=A0A6S6SYX3_9BACT|nr:MAG: Unknown protein [uncultured Sulfurovum sp.]